MALFERWLFWPLFAAIMGFALGGSFVWGVLYTPPNKNQRPTEQSDRIKHTQRNPGSQIAKPGEVPILAPRFQPAIWLAKVPINVRNAPHGQIRGGGIEFGQIQMLLSPVP
jgi:hypothetical protein